MISYILKTNIVHYNMLKLTSQETRKKPVNIRLLITMFKSKAYFHEFDSFKTLI